MRISIFYFFTFTLHSFASFPNIVWITAEDMSPVLGCYGDMDAKTPNIDKLARQSVRYTKAFASAPVCSPSRSCLIQGTYPTTLSTQQMRSGFPLPSYMKGFPALLHLNAGANDSRVQITAADNFVAFVGGTGDP